MHEKKTHEGKKRELFECLDEADKSLNRVHTRETSNSTWRGEYRRNNRQQNSDEGFGRNYNKRDSIFKRPDLPIARCLPTRRLPDYEKNPDKWTRYTLEDVSDTSDRMNTTAAFNFLRQIEEQKQKKVEESNDKDQKVVFKKSVKLRPKDNEPDPQLDAKKIQGNRVVMPEYVVGEKRKVQRPNRDRRSHTETSKPSKQLNLSHLNEDEDDEDSME